MGMAGWPFMKRIYVNEKWCLGCHLCEYYCAFANSGGTDMARTLQGVEIHPRIRMRQGLHIRRPDGGKGRDSHQSG